MFTEDRQGISSFTLKIMAIVAMTCSHAANVFATVLPAEAAIALYAAGGMTFPIMSFLLVEGYVHTSNVGRYAGRLLVFAALAQVPYSLLWGAMPNVLFTLALCLGVLYAHDRLQSRAHFAVLLVAAVLLSTPFDWGALGVVMTLMLYLLREDGRRIPLTMTVTAVVIGIPAVFQLAGAAGALGAANTIEQAGTAVASLANLGYATIGTGAAAVLLSRYDGKRGRPMKWFFYCYYPAHLLAIWLISQLVG